MASLRRQQSSTFRDKHPTLIRTTSSTSLMGAPESPNTINSMSQTPENVDLHSQQSHSPRPGGRSGSGSGSVESDREAPTTSKRSIVDRMLRRHKVPLSSSLRHLPSSGSSTRLNDSGGGSNRRDKSPRATRARNGSLESNGPNGKQWDTIDYDRKKDSKKWFFFGHPDKGRREGNEETSFPLDTDLTDLNDIVQRPVSPKDTNGPYGKYGMTGAGVEEKRPGSSIANWRAPESWASMTGDDMFNKPSRPPQPEEDELDKNELDSEGHPYCVRVFRSDSTFTTLPAPLNTTVTNILEILARKAFLQDELDNYEIVMYKNDLSRILDHSERPIRIQKRLLHQAGYKESDRIADIGREDNSYLVRFTFLPKTMAGYASSDGIIDLPKVQHLAYVNLESRGLITIPISLYTRARQILSLNLSRNLSLAVPRDFITRCQNLREIKYVGNEALHLPASFSLASRLTFLDISNNCLQELDHVDLHHLRSLHSLKIANNRLTSLPRYFSQFVSLRSLNVSSNSFTHFPESLTRVRTLGELDISFNQISKIPNLDLLQNLDRLWITNNQLCGSLGETFKNLVNLREIDARFNHITSIDCLTQLPRLENLLVGHNDISTFSGSFTKLRTLVLDHCPVTEFDFTAPIPSLVTLNIASAKLVQFKDSMFANMPNLSKLVLDKNHFVTLSLYIGVLQHLEYLSMVENRLTGLPPTIGCLTELKYLNLRECRINRLPPEIWFCSRLETLNLSTNVLDDFPRPSVEPPSLPHDFGGNSLPNSLPESPSYEELGPLETFDSRRPSHSSNYNRSNSTPSTWTANQSLPTGRKPSTNSRTTFGTSTTFNDAIPGRKDSSLSQLSHTFVGSLKTLLIADNRLEDEVFRRLGYLSELRVLNLSYNGLTELPLGILKCWQSLTELYLSGNFLSALPADDFEENSPLQVLHLNYNKFQVLPAELSRLDNLTVLDVGSNALRYNVSNWRWDWNWHWNHKLKYLNFSGNRRFEIKTHNSNPAEDLANFISLSDLCVLGLMDVTLMTPAVPDQSLDRRVRTSESLSETISYGMADTLGKTEHLSMVDMVIPRFRSNDFETVLALFDGRASSTAGSMMAKYLYENFTPIFTGELSKLREGEGATDALRRSFLALNKDIATASLRPTSKDTFDPDSARLCRNMADRGGVATVLYLQNVDLYVANVGNAQAILIKSNGDFQSLTQKHDPAEASERQRIRSAGGYVSRNGKLNDALSVSRAFGYFRLLPAVIAAPSTVKITLTEQDEMVIVASSELWEYISPDVVADVARSEKTDLMVASEKLRDLAIAYGAKDKIMVMIAGVADLKRREKNKQGLGFTNPEQVFQKKRPQRDAPSDPRLARWEPVEAPTGEVAIIFTDIKNSTAMWENHPVAMRSAIQIHNELFRRQLGIFRGYEAKTEGDAFMVSFSTPASALLWCFMCQMQLLDQEWPNEVLDANPGGSQYDDQGNLIYRGLSVRMGIHWGRPVCEQDPVTGRMDYFGPMVNRAARICTAADGGQIFVSADFYNELNRSLNLFSEMERTGSIGGVSLGSYSMTSDESDDARGFKRELSMLRLHGFGVRPLGERRLKGLENPEWLMELYPQSLAGRLLLEPSLPPEDVFPVGKGDGEELMVPSELLGRLYQVALRMERVCSSIEAGVENAVAPGGGSSLTAVRDGDMTELWEMAKGAMVGIKGVRVMAVIENLVTRIEGSVNTLALRNFVQPFEPGEMMKQRAFSISDVFALLRSQMDELAALRIEVGQIRTPVGGRVDGRRPSSLSIDLDLAPNLNGLDDNGIRNDDLATIPGIEAGVYGASPINIEKMHSSLDPVRIDGLESEGSGAAEQRERDRKDPKRLLEHERKRIRDRKRESYIQRTGSTRRNVI